jgi:hypothetical protein
MISETKNLIYWMDKCHAAEAECDLAYATIERMAVDAEAHHVVLAQARREALEDAVKTAEERALTWRKGTPSRLAADDVAWWLAYRLLPTTPASVSASVPKEQP